MSTGGVQKQVAMAAFLGCIGGLLLGFWLGHASTRAAPAAVAAPHPPAAVVPDPLPPPRPEVARVAAPPPARARDVGTPPYKLHSFTIHRWDGPAWRIRANLQVTRLREAPDGTRLGCKVTCRVGGTVFVSGGLIEAPGGPVGLGETGPTISDHFFHHPFAGIPEQCELLLYVAMPGARADQIDHDAGRVCIEPGAQKDRIADGPCPVLLEALSP